jgi:hypothetical protein
VFILLTISDLIHHSLNDNCFQHLEQRNSNMKKISPELMREMIEEIQCNDKLKQHILCISFSPERKRHLRNEVLDSLCEIGLKSHEIIAAGPVRDNSKWLITLNCKDSCVKLMSYPPEICGAKGRITTLDSNIVYIWVHWLPLLIPHVRLLHFCANMVLCTKYLR